MQPTPAEWTRGAFTVTCDPARQDLDVIHGFLTACYWAKGIPRETVARSLAGALCFAIRHRAGDEDQQVGFARVISDRATIAYIGDVFVLPGFRGQGLSKWLMDCIAGLRSAPFAPRRRLSSAARLAGCVQTGGGFMRHLPFLAQVVVGLSTVAALACSPAEQRDAQDEARTAGRQAAAGLENGAVVAAVKAKLIAEPTVSGLRIDVDAKDGVVTLSGTVPSFDARTRAVELAKGTNGVRRVDDRLRIAP